MSDPYRKLAEHLESLVMGYPFNDGLLDLLQGMFDPDEAAVALGLPNGLDPLESVDAPTAAEKTGLDPNRAERLLEAMADRNVIFSRTDPDGRRRYALHQIGYGLPQSFFWHGRDDETSRKMARLILKYFDIPTTGKVYGATPTKTYKYAPANRAVDIAMQGVLPAEEITAVVQNADKIALAHCPCRMSARILGRTDCAHSLEVCFKYDDMAEFVISRGLARPVSKDETLKIMADCEREGLVHMVDNALGGVKHTCNCCGHYCWNVGIIRRRKIPRDQLMAVYFTRQTDFDGCIGCGACADICPVDAVTMMDDRAETNPDWCIGCGVCAAACPTGAISIVRRNDIELKPPQTTEEMFGRIRLEKSAIVRKGKA